MKRLIPVASALAVVPFLGCTCTSSKLGFLLFVSRRDGNHEIYRMNYNGSGLTNLTNNSARDYNPSLSKDGQKIAFASDRSGSYEIWTMNANGSNPTQLTFNAGDSQNYHPAWNPTGTRIAYVDNSQILDGAGEIPYDIAVINADGSGYVNLTNSSATELHPAWSPDGTKIAFTSDEPGLNQIFIMNADGSNKAQLTFGTVSCQRPSFAPDGRIVFWSTDVADGPNRILFIMNQDGSNLTPINVGSSDNWAPAVSPDGSRLLFGSTRDGNSEIYSARLDGSNPVNLTNNASDDHDVVTSIGR